MNSSRAAVIPIYNNPRTVSSVVNVALKIFSTVIVVDDGSDIPVKNILSDATHLVVMRHEQNKGKGAALITGLKKAKELGFEYVVTMDADGQHEPSDIIPLINKIAHGTLYVGNRNMNVDNVPNVSKFGRRFSNFWIYLETGKNVADSQCGFRVYPVSVAEKNYCCTGFDWEVEVIVRHVWSGGEITDFPVSVKYFPENERVSHFKKFRDNAKISLLHCRLMFMRIVLLKGFFR